jgi:DNA-nicking Smr family endonuclease
VPIRIVNLEEGMPTANAALLRLDHALATARSERLRFLKLIHGYGSSGVGGRLREEVWMALSRMERDGVIAGFLPGEDFRRSDSRTWELVKRHKELEQDRDFGRGNRGITIVIL